jgi:hypothetical protein
MGWAADPSLKAGEEHNESKTWNRSQAINKSFVTDSDPYRQTNFRGVKMLLVLIRNKIRVFYDSRLL